MWMAAATSLTTEMPTTVPANTLWEIQEVGKDLYGHGLVTSHGGNLSVRSGTDMWITGTGTMLGRLQERHISLVHADGRHEGRPPSSDTILHTTIYALTTAQAVVHAHARRMTALSFETDLFVPPDFEGKHHLTDIPVVAQGARQEEQIALALQFAPRCLPPRPRSLCAREEPLGGPALGDGAGRERGDRGAAAVAGGLRAPGREKTRAPRQMVYWMLGDYVFRADRRSPWKPKPSVLISDWRPSLRDERSFSGNSPTGIPRERLQFAWD